MAWYNRFPWTNFHELNLDWILEICGKAEKAIPEIDEAITRADTAADSANSAADLANSSATGASDAAAVATNAARKIDPITATAATVHGASASVTVEDTNPGKVFHFLIPAGEKGDPGPAGGAGDLIDNGNFSNPINQRGSTSYNGTGSKMYTIDRWFTTSSVSGAVVVGNRYITVASGATVSQIIPADQDGSFPSDADVGYTAVARETNGTLHIANGAGLTDSKLSFTLGDAGAGITVTLGSGNWEYCALYRGSYTASNVPGYVAKEYATQLAQCQRYYIEVGVVDFYARTRWLFYSDWIRFAFPMRVTPTMSYKNPETGTEGVIGVYSNGTYTDVSGIGIKGYTYGFRVDGGVDGILQPDTPYKGYFTASADM